MTRRTHVVTYLAGDGIGPEVTAEASRALALVSRMHGFAVEERHPHFGREAVARSGHALPPSTRDAVLGSDAVLVAGWGQPALDGVRAELDLRASVTRVHLDEGSGLTFFAPLAEGGEAYALERAFACARASGGSLASIGLDESWRGRVDRAAEEHDGVLVRHLPLGEALPLLAFHPSQVDVLVTERVLAEALPQVPRPVSGGRRLAATGLLSPSGPGLFCPSHGPVPDIAGQGVANPSEMLLAAALMLGEGLGRRAAAETLEGGVDGALDGTVRTADMAGSGPAATTREFVDVVLSLLPGARQDLEVAL